MAGNYKLFIDETGHPHQNHHSTHFALVGIVIDETKQNDLQIKTDQLRFKYWDRTNIVFHSEEIGRKVGDFKQFANDKTLHSKFQKQLLSLISSAPFLVTASVIDKSLAYRIGWKDTTIVSKASEALILDFMAYLYGQNALGRVVYEASGSTRDSIYLGAYHRYIDPQWAKTHSEFSDVREHLTSITFANKLNHDTEMQLADIFSYAAICKNKQLGGHTYEKNSYESKLIKILDKKLLSMPQGITNKLKLKYYSQIKGLTMLPKLKPKPQKTKKKTA